MLWIIPVGINFKGLREMMIFSYNLKIFFFQYFIHIIKMVTHNGNFYCDSNKKRTMIYFLFSRLHHSSCKSFILYLIYSYSIFTIDDLISLILNRRNNVDLEISVYLS
ncbi:unnamed protein product [Rhizophagus irregularis]|uniref:Uncharacterized protein n=1 Tax=Rhizophagus irregularis TaxID=588596 RepID=A0A915YZ65_9GLOM|nr:unnamed protein product [Rhizophagus irregularis]